MQVELQTIKEQVTLVANRLLEVANLREGDVFVLGCSSSEICGGQIGKASSAEVGQTAQNALANLVTLLLGISVAFRMQADDFLTWQTLLILALGLVGFVFDTVGGVFFAKFLNLFSKKKINPMIGAAGISAFPMSGRVVNQMGLAEDNQNFLLMYSISVNVSGQIASVIAGGLLLTLMGA